MLAKKILLIGSWRVHPTLNQIQSGTQTLELEPRAMELLLFLSRHPDEVISRDDLIEQVWKGAIVTDQAINRVVSLLRKALGDDAANPRYIATISKRGYRLVAPVSEELAGEPSPRGAIPERHAPELNRAPPDSESAALTAYLANLNTSAEPRAEPLTAPEPGPHRSAMPTHQRWPGRRWLAGLILVATSGLLVVYARTATLGADEPRYGRAKALTAMAGNEHFPSNSPDGRFIVFSHRPREEGEYRQLQLLDTQNGQTQRLTLGPFVDDYPAWAPDGQRIAFHRRGEKTCQVMSLTIKDGRGDMDSLRELASCNTSTAGVSLAWNTRGDKLYYTDAATVNEPLRILELDVASGKSRPITNPPDLGRGDYFIQAARQAPTLYFLRNKHWNQTEIFSLDLEDGSIDKRLSLAWPLVTMSLHPQGKELLFRDISGLFTRLNLDTGKTQTLPAPITVGLNPVYMSNGREIAFANGPERDRNIKFLPNPLAQGKSRAFRPSIDSSQQDDTPALAPKSSRLVFVSNRSGLPQIWLQEVDGSLRQLSNFDHYDHIAGLFWSPQEDRILVHRGSRLSLLDPVSGQQEGLAIEDKNLELPRWSADGKSLYFSSQRSGQREIYRHELATGQEAALTRHGGYAALPSADGKYFFYTKYHQAGLWRMSYTDGAEELVLPELSQFNPEQLVLGARGVYYTKEEEDEQVLKFQAFAASTPQTVARVKRGPHQRYVLSGDESLLALEISERLDTDLYLLTEEPSSGENR